MIGIAFYPYKNEVLYSWIVRYHKYSANDKESQSKQDLFNNPYVDVKIHYPTYIKALSKHLMISGFSSDEIINNLTYLNVVKPFFNEERYIKAKDGVLEPNQFFVQNHGFHINNLFNNNKNSLKVCPICFKEDKELVGEPYLHRPHNAVGVKTCYKHGCYLEEFKHTFHQSHNMFDISKDYIPNKAVYPDKELINLHDRVNQDIVYILKGNLNSVNTEVIKRKLSIKFKKIGLFAKVISEKHERII